MTVDLSTQLLELQKSTDHLNALTDKANDVVRRVETFLINCRVGGYASVAIPDEEVTPDEGPSWDTWLVYDRHKGDYRIKISHCLDGEERESKPWAECSRELKLKALDVLPELISKLHKMVAEQIETARAKVDRLDKMVPPGAELQRPAASKMG